MLSFWVFTGKGLIYKMGALRIQEARLTGGYI